MRWITMLLTTVLCLAACSEAGDEEQIAQTITDIQQAVEQKQFAAIEQHLHKGFVANGQMGIDEVRQLLRLHSLRHKKLNVAIVGSNTTLHANLADRADSVVSVIVTGSSGLVPTDGSARTVNVEWVKQSGDWLITRASWRP